MRKFFKTVHLWMALPLGLVMAITCLSGALLVFENEISSVTNRNLYNVQNIGQERISIAQAIQIVEPTLDDSVKVTGVTIFGDPKKAYQINLSKPRRASIYVDQYSGQINGRAQRSPFFTFVFKAHRWLLDSANPNGGVFWGKMIVGISTLMFVFVVISGAIVWIPKTARSLKNRLKISARKGWLRFWYDLHVAGGIYATVLLLVMALTGLTWSFSWYRSGFYAVLGVETKKEAPHIAQNSALNSDSNSALNSASKENQHKKHSQGDRSQHAHGENRGEQQGENRGENHGSKIQDSIASQSIYDHWDEVYAQVAALNGGAEKISISKGKASVAVSGWGNSRAADSYTFDPQSGELNGQEPYATSSDASKLRGWIYSLHVGSWGGWFSKVLTFLAALMGAILPLTGYYFYLHRLARSCK